MANRFVVPHTRPQNNLFPHLYSMWSEHWCYMTFVKSKPNAWLTNFESKENKLNTFDTVQCTIQQTVIRLQKSG